MGRVLLILTAACLAATFMIINNSSFRSATTTTSPKAEEAKSKSEKERQARREKESRARASARSPIVKSRAASSSKSYRAPFEIGGAADEVEIVQDGSHATVKGDQTPVYSVNSKDSNIVKLLNKGDQVSTDLEVIDAKGRWTIVNKSDLTKPGFVQPENLQPARSTKNKEIKKAAR